MLLSNRSIAIRLAVSSLLWSTIVLVDAAAFLYHLYYQSTEQTFDNRLTGYANSVTVKLMSSVHSGDDLGAIGDIQFELPFSGWYWEVSRYDNRQDKNFSSLSLFGKDLALPREWREIGKDTTSAIRWGYGYAPNGERVRIVERDIKFDDKLFYYVRVAGPAQDVADATSRFLYILMGTFSLLGIGWIITTFVQIRYGLQPLKEMQHALSSVRAGNNERVEGTYPKDIAPLADELNLLLDTNREILDRARTQVGNLAHALKTPLSVIMNEAETGNPKLAAKIKEQTQLMRDQVEYHLNRAQAAALVGVLGMKTPVNEVVDALMRTFRKIYHNRNLVISASVPEHSFFFGEKQDLQELLGNIIDNACKWSQTQVHLTMTSFEETGRRKIRFVIDDDGSGIHQSDIKAAIQRGQRLDETQPGTGLGLSIVTDISSLYRGRFVCETSPLGGLRVLLELPGECKTTEDPDIKKI